MRYLLNYVRTWVIINIKRLWRLADDKKGAEYTKFAIICSPRSGSTLLHTYLNSHSEILSLGEVMRRKVDRGEELVSIHEFAFTPHSKRIKAVGLKLFYGYMENSMFKERFDEVVDDKEIKIIHLKRLAVDEQLESLKRAKKTGLWSTTLRQRNEAAISLSEEELSDFDAKIRSHMGKVEELFKDHGLLEITYEYLVDNPKDALNEIQEFIKVQPKQLFTLLKKQGSQVH